MKDTNTKITMDDVYVLYDKWNGIKELCNKWENGQDQTNPTRKMTGDLIELKVNIHPNKMNLTKPTKNLLNLPSK